MTHMIPDSTLRPIDGEQLLGRSRNDTGKTAGHTMSEGTEPPSPCFGLSYVVSAAARFDPPWEMLGDFLTDDLADVDLVDDVITRVRLVQTGVIESDRIAQRGFECALTPTGVRVSAIATPGTDTNSLDLSYESFTSALADWRTHLEQVPEYLDRASAESAASQRRVAAVSWLESAVALTASKGWSAPAGQLDGIAQAITDGAHGQVRAMHEAAVSWRRLRPELASRCAHDDQVDVIVAALDHLLGAD
jgi:hypothetical protein